MLGVLLACETYLQRGENSHACAHRVRARNFPRRDLGMAFQLPAWFADVPLFPAVFISKFTYGFYRHFNDLRLNNSHALRVLHM